MKLKVDRLEYEKLESEIERKKENEIEFHPEMKKDIELKYRDLKNFEILPLDTIQDYLDEMAHAGWNLMQVVPIYYPIRSTGTAKLFGIDYYWQKD